MLLDELPIWIRGFRGRIQRDGDCWLWAGAHTSLGYGMVRVYKERPFVHRFVFELFRGPIPEGLVLDHLCRKPACFNPDHLEAVTQRENLLRGHTIVAQFAKATHCVHGHIFDASNTYRGAYGRNGLKGRNCRTCGRLRARLYRAQRRDAEKAKETT